MNGVLNLLGALTPVGTSMEPWDVHNRAVVGTERATERSLAGTRSHRPEFATRSGRDRNKGSGSGRR